MLIKIAEKLCPYSHVPGTACILPGSFYRLEIFPTRVRIYDLHAAHPQLLTELLFSFKGPIREFTLYQDLEKGSVKVQGHSQEGYFYYSLRTLLSGGIYLDFKKRPENTSWELTTPFSLTDSIDQSSLYTPPLTDRLSLGNHKSQDWQLVVRRGLLEEIFPIWMRLGQLLPPIRNTQLSGTASWLKNTLESRPCNRSLDPFLNLFYAGFEGMLSPRLVDNSYQGLECSSEPIDPKAAPCIILAEGAKQIRSLFIETHQNQITFLPRLPSQFHCGRLIHVQMGEFGLIDIEWSKKMLRKAVIYAACDGVLQLNFQKDHRSFRLRQGKETRGIRLKCPSSLEIKRGNVYFLDNIQK